MCVLHPFRACVFCFAAGADSVKARFSTRWFKDDNTRPTTIDIPQIRDLAQYHQAPTGPPQKRHMVHTHRRTSMARLTPTACWLVRRQEQGGEEERPYRWYVRKSKSGRAYLSSFTTIPFLTTRGENSPACALNILKAHTAPQTTPAPILLLLPFGRGRFPKQCHCSSMVLDQYDDTSQALRSPVVAVFTKS